MLTTRKIKIPNISVKNNEALYKSRKQPDCFDGDMHHRIMVFIGGIGSGKTTRIVEYILLMLTTNSYDKIFWVSPTFRDDCGKADNIDPDILEIVDEYTDSWLVETQKKMKEAIKEYKIYLEYEKVYDKCIRHGKKLDTYEEALLIMHNFEPPYTPYKHGFPCFLMVFDDQVAEKKIFSANMKGACSKFFLNCRHHSCSIILSSQIFKHGTPTCLRGGNVGSWILYRTSSDKMKKTICEELAEKIKPDELVKKWEYACQQPFDFFLVDYANKDPTKRFRRNWDNILVGGEDPITEKPTKLQ